MDCTNNVKYQCFLLFSFFHFFGYAQEEGFSIDGLIDSVEIITDVWGIPHIYAQNEHDLFFAQGFYAAKDRLFQFELWRRQATGTVAELLGEREINRDYGARLFQFRGDMDLEMNHYHPNGSKIIRDYVDGVNQYIDWVLEHPSKLPIEFKLLNTKPQKWTPAVVLSRHQGLLGNSNQELNIGRAVVLIGEKKVKELLWLHPKEPSLQIDPKIDHSLLFEDILAPYNAFRRAVRFIPNDIIASLDDGTQTRNLVYSDHLDMKSIASDELLDIGSNNWVVSGDLTESGFPIMANDPHRRQSSPSLRYMAHLVAPGWNVIGGGEPEIPGISIGHNEYGAWGLTVFRTDAEDLYVYDINPNNPNQYLYKDQWEDMLVIMDTIPVKNRDPKIVELRYTRHGPVTFVNTDRKKAVAMRCGWLEIGGSPYLASLRMDQARDFEEFRQACQFSHIPGENMVWADRKGNIGWQAVGIAPIRRNWSGLVPVPGDGSYEWDGYLPILKKPHAFNPPSGIINTSNENVTPKDYKYWDAIGHSWTDPYRSDRVREVLSSGVQHSLTDMAALQTDVFSIPARQLTPLIKDVEIQDARVLLAREYLIKWDGYMDAQSIPAGIYNAWEKELRAKLADLLIPVKARPYLSLQMKRILEYLRFPDKFFGEDPMAGRDRFLISCLSEAVDKLTLKLGHEMSKWKYGQERYKHITIAHPLSEAVSTEIRKKLDVGPAPRGGNSFTVNNTSSSDNQVSGASFRMIVDVANWDHTLGSNTPGLNGDPDHPHYNNLFEIWAKDQFFPVFYSREKVLNVKYKRWSLVPQKK